jgi:hypothetical protein
MVDSVGLWRLKRGGWMCAVSWASSLSLSLCVCVCVPGETEREIREITDGQAAMKLTYVTAQVWLDSTEEGGTSGDPDEVAFPPTAQVADLTDIARDALLPVLPAAPRCSSPSCLAGTCPA